MTRRELEHTVWGGMPVLLADHLTFSEIQVFVDDIVDQIVARLPEGVIE